MKFIISENQSRLIRRMNMVEDMLYPTMETAFNSMMETNYGQKLNNERFEAFRLIVGHYISSRIVEDSHVGEGDDMIILRNQLQNYIKNHYYAEMRDYFNERNGN